MVNGRISFDAKVALENADTCKTCHDAFRNK